MFDLKKLDKKINEMVEKALADAVELFPQALQIDKRVNGVIFAVENSCIAVTSDVDRRLQRYGGFNNVDPDFRKVYGDWVIYLAFDEMVEECLLNYFG